MSNLEHFQAQLDRCCGPARRPYVKPKPMTGIEKHELEHMDLIQDEYHNTFGKQERN